MEHTRASLGTELFVDSARRAAVLRLRRSGHFAALDLVLQTEELKEPIRDAIIKLCVEAHQEQDFRNLFTYVPSGGWHFLAYQDELLVSHALVTTRWLHTKDQSLLKTAYIDAVATLPAYQGQGYGSALMRQLASDIDRKYMIACLETDRETFYERLG